MSDYNNYKGITSPSGNARYWNGGKPAKWVRCEDGREWESINEASRCTNTDATSISKACRGKAKLAGGMEWEFITISEDGHIMPSTRF